MTISEFWAKETANGEGIQKAKMNYTGDTHKAITETEKRTVGSHKEGGDRTRRQVVVDGNAPTGAGSSVGAGSSSDNRGSVVGAPGEPTRRHSVIRT